MIVEQTHQLVHSSILQREMILKENALHDYLTQFISETMHMFLFVHNCQHQDDAGM